MPGPARAWGPRDPLPPPLPSFLMCTEFWDIRTPEENAEGAKRWMKNIPFAFMGESGPVLNKRVGGVELSPRGAEGAVVRPQPL